jgi:hypothetical protein
VQYELAGNVLESPFAIGGDQIPDLQRAAFEEAQRIQCLQADELREDAVAITELDGLVGARVVPDQADAADVAFESASCSWLAPQCGERLFVDLVSESRLTVLAGVGCCLDRLRHATREPLAEELVGQFGIGHVGQWPSIRDHIL